MKEEIDKLKKSNDNVIEIIKLKGVLNYNPEE